MRTRLVVARDMRRTALDALAFVAIIGAAVLFTDALVTAAVDQAPILSLGIRG